LEQYDAPAEILRNPADAFVEVFLGSDRGIKRLSLISIRDVGLVSGPVVEVTSSTDAARAVMAEYAVDWFGISDGDRLLGWAPATDLDGGGAVGDVEPRDFATRLGLGDSLREALDTVITSHTQVAPVFDGERYVGMLTTDAISREIAQ
ncbi:MAG: ABC transporter ATP-binding protein, partial [Acidimicrobiia bacterium]|nr:ABC transporter ATP-binding protein [Acidimicrobiia bacterium]